MKLLIVEDDTAFATYLCKKINQYFPDIVIVGISSSVKDAVEKVNMHNPNFLLMDVLLNGDDLSFEILDRLSHKSLPTVFITGFSHYALQAFKVHAIDYITKPIDDASLVQAVSRAISKSSKVEIQIAELYSKMKLIGEEVKRHLVDEKILLPITGKMVVTCCNDIICILAKGAYSEVYLKERKPIVLAKNLSMLSSLLPEHTFYRAHRSAIININKIFELRNENNGTYVLLENGLEVKVSTELKNTLRERLGLLKL